MYRSNKTVTTIPAFLICDQRFIDTWGLGLALPGGRPRQHLLAAGYLIQAPTLAALAAKIGAPARALAATGARYNTYAAQGQDPDFGKGGTAYNRYLGDPEHQPNPCLAPLADGSCDAVKVYPGDIGTACGIAANANAQAVLQSWADAEWFTGNPEVPQSLTVTVFKVPGETNTDDLSPAPDATTRPDIPMHALAMLKNKRDDAPSCR
ncbi:hypothetical protein G6F24_014716 [Rhizopus arrhizus]|nr:hypothetical protein G6F24_014716 [Rhizopus arrhizus]